MQIFENYSFTQIYYYKCFILSQSSIKAILPTSNRTLSRYEGNQQSDNGTVFKPSVKYIKFSPTYENIPEKIREVEEEVYEVLEKEQVTIMDGGVASSEQPYDKLDFSH